MEFLLPNNRNMSDFWLFPSREIGVRFGLTSFKINKNKKRFQIDSAARICIITTINRIPFFHFIAYYFSQDTKKPSPPDASLKLNALSDLQLFIFGLLNFKKIKIW